MPTTPLIRSHFVLVLSSTQILGKFGRSIDLVPAFLVKSRLQGRLAKIQTLKRAPKVNQFSKRHRLRLWQTPRVSEIRLLQVEIL